MTAAGYAGVLGTLAMVLGLVLVLAKLARRWMPGAVGGETPGVRVVQRVALGQKQSLAIVEVGGKRIALGIGDGGVRQLFTIDDDAGRTPLAAPSAATAHHAAAARDIAPTIAAPVPVPVTPRSTAPIAATPRASAPAIATASTTASVTATPGTVTPLAIDLVARPAVPSPTDWLRRIPSAGAAAIRTTPAATPTTTNDARANDTRISDTRTDAIVGPVATPRRDTPVATPSLAMLAQLPAPLMMPTPLVVPAIPATGGAPALPTLAQLAAAAARGTLDGATTGETPAVRREAPAPARAVTTRTIRTAGDRAIAARRADARATDARTTDARATDPRAVLPDYVRAAMAMADAERRDGEDTLARVARTDAAFGDALRLAMQRGAALLGLVLLGALAPATARAQAAAPPAPVPAATTPAPTAGGEFVPVAPGAARPGPRDLPARAEPRVQAPRPDRPARTAAAGGGAPSIAPLVPAGKAAAIAAERARATGNAPLTTAEARAMQRRVDSTLATIAPTLDLQFGKSSGGDGLRLSGTVGVVVMMGLLSMLPLLLLMMTAFTRIMVVLAFLKQALGTQGTPPGQLVAALALVLSGFVMAPTLREVNTTALEPWLEGRIEQVEMMQRAVVPFRTFMLAQVGDKELQTFVDLSGMPQPETRETVPLMVLMSAFVTSELRTAFQIGFALFLPFIIVDVVVSAVLMSMGMMMLPPAMISLPFKLLLFVLVDGWSLVVTGLVQSFA